MITFKIFIHTYSSYGDSYISTHSVVEFDSKLAAEKAVTNLAETRKNLPSTVSMMITRLY